MANPKTVQPLAKVEAKTAAEICGAVTLPPPALKLLDPQVSPADFLARLCEADMARDALGFLAHALPRREAVWWACQCIREAGLESDEAASAALLAAARWAADPSEENRRAANDAAERADSTPQGFVALAAFFTGGSVAPPGSPEIQPTRELAPRILTGALLMTAVAREPEKASQKFQRFVEIGIQTANQPLPGGNGA
jgi:Family of unknown function (DUF6931)